MRAHARNVKADNLLQKSFNKFFNCHALIVEKYGAAQQEMRLAIQACTIVSLHHLFVFQLYLDTCARAFFFFFFMRVHYLFSYLIDVYI